MRYYTIITTNPDGVRGDEYYDFRKKERAFDKAFQLEKEGHKKIFIDLINDSEDEYDFWKCEDGEIYNSDGYVVYDNLHKVYKGRLVAK